MSLVLFPKQMVADINGVPRVGAKLYLYDDLTSTAHPSYTSPDYSVALTYPILSLSDGFFPRVEVDPTDGPYKIVIKDANDVTIYTEDVLSPFDITADQLVDLIADDASASAAMGALVFGQNPQYADSEAEIGASLATANYYPIGNAIRYGADPTGATDSTIALQNWINSAWAMFTYADAQGVWGGGGGAIPALVLPPGKYKITNTLYLPTGCTIRGEHPPCNTTNHTRIIMDSTATSAPSGSGDNRNRAIFKFKRGTLPSGGTLANQYHITRIQWLELAYVTPGSTFSNPYSGTGIPFDDYPEGASIYIDVDTVDMRFIDVVFQNTPCAIRVKNVLRATGSVITRPDGLQAGSPPITEGIAGSGSGAFFYAEDCEFDAAAAHLHAETAYIDARFNNCKFYGGRTQLESCSGNIVYDNPQFFGDAWVSVDNTNTLKLFHIQGGDIEPSTSQATVSVKNAKTVNISGVAFAGATGTSAIDLYDCPDGNVSNNLLQGIGYNAGAGTGYSDYSAAIKALGCGLNISDNAIIDATTGGTFNGFGILTGPGTGSSSCTISGNLIKTAFNGALVGGLSRFLNYTSTDRVGLNYEARASAAAYRIGSHAQRRTTLTYSASITIDATLANHYDFIASNGTAFTINAPTTPIDGHVLTLTVKNASGGALGAITWNAVFKMAAWTSPGNGSSRSITFRYDGTNWVEIGRTTADVPN